MKIAVIGAGSMGSWFARQFLERNHSVKIYDKNLSKLSSLERVGARACSSLDEAVEDVEMVLAAVPIESTAKVVRAAANLMGSGVVAEIASLKLPVIETLRRLPKEINPLSLHPLFGPGLRDLREGRFALIPVRSLVNELEVARRVFDGAEFVTVSAEEHDEAMAYTLSLTHLISLAASLTLPANLIELLKRLSGTSFSSLASMMSASLEETPSTFTQILKLNKNTVQIADKFLDRFEEVLESIRLGNYDEVEEYLRKGFEVTRMLR